MKLKNAKSVIVILICVSFIFGFFIGKAIAPTNTIPHGTGYPIVYTPNSDIAQFDGYTGAQLNSVLKGTALDGLGFWFSYYAWQNNISSLYLVSHAIHESAWGTSYIARRKHNLFGFGAFDSSPYWSANYYPSFKDCIQQVSGFVAKNYLTEGGIWYKGNTLRAMNIHYATDKEWADKIANIMNMLAFKMGSPQKSLAVAENEYYQDFENKDYDLSKSFDKYVSKGQFVRDLYAIMPVRGYKSAGVWAIKFGLIKDTPHWWVNKITRNEEIQIINKLYSIYFPYVSPPKFQHGDYYEKYSKYYVFIIQKLRREH